MDRVPLAFGKSGYLEEDAFAASGYRIAVNSKLPIEKQRWTVLHEIGHYLLHRSGDRMFQREFLDRSKSSFYASPKEETEANAVADVLLFGDGALEAAPSLYRGDVNLLARHFGVTARIIEIALQKYVSPTKG